MPFHRDSGPIDATLVTPGPPWAPIEVHDEVGSTNSLLTAAPVPWRVISAERQSAGRGRLARPWVTSPGTALAVSVCLPSTPGMPLGWVPLIAGLALAEAIAETAGIPAALKWPNDVLLPGDGNRKVAGILCEWVAVGDGGVVVGSGVNVHQTRDQLPLDTATSVRAAGGETTREALLTAYLRHLALLHGDLAFDPEAVRTRYAAACRTLGATVVVHEPGGDRRGVATEVDRDGRLCLRTDAGPYAVSAGDVVHVRPAT